MTEEQRRFSEVRHEQPLRVGVLALQGAYRDHSDVFSRLGCNAIDVRTTRELSAIDALVMPGGESTAIRHGLERAGLYEILRTRIAHGMPVLATCAGLVVLANAPADGAPPVMSVLDVDVSRNGFGRQVHSCEQWVRLADGSRLLAPFIRAPRIERIGTAVEPIGWIDEGEHVGEVVAVRSGAITACTFHPELTDSTVFHEALVGRIAAASM